MGVEVREAMSISMRFGTFLDNIRLTDIQTSNGKTSRESVCGALNANYYGLASGTANSRYVGSWDKYTRIRPPRDVDVLFQLPKSVYDRFQQRTGNKQSQLLQEVKSVLLSRFPNTAIRGNGPVVVVPFKGFAVELLPAFLLENGRYWIPVTTNGGDYKTTDPTAEADKVKESNDKTNDNTRELVRMLKCWQDVCGVPAKSFWLELLAIGFLDQWQYAGNSRTYYDWMARDFFAYMVSQSGSYVTVPGTYEIIWIRDAWKSRAESARYRAEKACEYEAKEMPNSALAEWQKIFGNYIS